MKRAFWLALLLCSGTALAGQGVAAQGKGKPAALALDSLLQRAPFSAAPAELLALHGAKTPEGLDVEVLLDDTTYRYDAQGRERVEYHMVYRVLTEQGVADWGSVGISYHPWHQERPEIRARIVTHDGRTQELSAGTLVDAAAAAQGDDMMYSDRKNLSGPLPSVGVGSVVETWVATQEHRPLFEAGSLQRYIVYANTYTALSRVRVVSPKSLALSHGLWGAPHKLDKSVQNGVQTLSYLQRDVLPLTEWPSAVDPTLALAPTLELGTGKSWGEVAAAYGRAVDAQLAGFDAKAIADKVVGNETDAKKKLAKLLAYLHHEVRYVGLELGESSLLPAAPATALQRRYGDCKDKATLLVGLARAAGMPACVALLRTGPGFDVHPEVAGLGLFDHAIVYVAADATHPALWIDATDPYAAPGELPYNDQDRQALLARADTRTLTRTPRSTAADSGWVEDVSIDFSELGLATVKETTTGSGAIQAELRGDGDEPEKQLTTHTEAYVKDRYGAKIRTARADNVGDPEKPYALVIEASDAKSFETYDDGGLFDIGPYGLFGRLPSRLLDKPEARRSAEDDDAKPKPDARHVEPPAPAVYVSRPHHALSRYHLALPDGFAWQALPDPVKMESDGIQLESRVVSSDERHAVYELELRTDARLIPAERIEAVRTLIDDFDQQTSLRLRFVHEAREAMEHDQVDRALALHRALLAKHPKSVAVVSRYAQDLVRMGFGESARRVARELAKAHPESARAQWSLGWVLSFDTVGRDSAPGADFAGAEKAYRAALARDPDESLYYRALGVALERRALRARVSDPAALRETIQLYEQLRGKLKNHEKDADLLRLHLWQGDFQEVARLAEGVEASEDRNAWWVTALAANVGAQAALHKAEQLAQNPAALIERASAMLAVLGRYEQAYALSQLPNVRKSLAVTARTYAAARDRARCESTLHPAALTVARWYREMLGDARGMDAVRERLEKLPEASIDRYSLESAARSVWDAMNRSGDGNTASAAPFVVDIFPCYVRWEVEEKNGAVRVKLFQQGAHDNEPPDVFYARKLGSTYSLVAFRMKGRTVGFSRAIFQALADKRVDEARTWLGWALDETKPYGGDAASYGFYDAVRSLTPSDPAHADEEDLSTLAAIFASGSGIDGRELKVLERAAKRFTHVPAALRAVSYGRSWLLPNEEGASQAALLAPLHQAFPEDGDLWQRYALALYRAKEYGSLSHELDAYDRKYPGNTFAPNWRNYMDWRRGQYGDVIARTQARLNEHRASRGELNNAAWNALFAKTDVHAVIGMAEAACEPEADASLEALHTLATLYAEVDEHDKAHTKLRGIIDRFGDDELSSSVWYTWGRLAEGLGLGDDARAAYTHVEKPEHDSGSDVFVLAQRRLAQLQTLHR